MFKKNLFLQTSFSLIELIIVVAIMATIAGLSLPRLKTAYENIQLQQAAEDLASLMRYAQGRSAARQEHLQIEFNANFSRYRLANRKNGQTQGLEGRWGRVFTVPKEVSIRFSDQTVSFYPDATMDRVRIYLTNEREKIYTVSTQEMRGRVQVFNQNIQ